MWAEALGAGEYRLCNVPFYAFDVSYEDVVGAVKEAVGLAFTFVIRRGGHSTYRLLLNEPRRAHFKVTVRRTTS